MRLGALFGSVMLIVAVAVGYVARRADLAHSRDVQIESTATIAAENLGAFIKVSEFSAAVAVDTGLAAQSLSDALDGADVCLADGTASAAAPTCTTDDAAFVHRATAMFGQSERVVTGNGARLEITIIGDAASVYTEVALTDLGMIDGPELAFLRTVGSPPAVASTIDRRRVSATPSSTATGSGCRRRPTTRLRSPTKSS
jgi:hypothetical protein